MIDTIVGSRVKLKNHVYFGLVQDGVLFDAGDASFVLKDKSAYPAVEKLVALIDAGNPVATILERAPAKLADFFQRVLASLAEHGMLLNVDEDVPAAERLVAHTAHNELRKFLEDRLGGRSVEAALRRWREAQVTVVGSGHALMSAVKALADSGCGRLAVMSDGRATAGLDELLDEIESSQALQVDIRTTFDDARPAGAAGVLVYASDDAVVALAARIEGVLRANGASGAIGAVFAGRACVLPAPRPGHPGVDDLLHWLPAYDDGAASLGPVAMALLGCVAAQAAICRFFGVEAPSLGGQAAMISPSLEVQYSALVASARGGGGHARFVHPIKYQAPDRPLLPFERIRYALEPWFDPVLGPFSVLANDEIDQVPLLQYPIRVRSAVDRDSEEVVVGWGLEHAGAVIHGLSQAIEALAHTFGQDGHAVVCEFDEEGWRRRALAQAVANSADMAARHQWAWVDLDQLPPGPMRILHALLRFHAPEGIRAQMQWDDAGNAFVVRVLREDAALCTVVGADPFSALTEGLGQACSMFQLQRLSTVRYGRHVDLPAPDVAAQVDDWRAALIAEQAAKAPDADFHLLALPGFPPTVYCGHATLKRTAGVR